jgi:hypothetical protein
MTTQAHCAKFSKELYEPIRQMISSIWSTLDDRLVYDPMAGVGTLEAILETFRPLVPVGSEIEEEYAAEKPWIIHEDCRDHLDRYQLIVTSPPYGNRMADQYLGTPAEQKLRAETGRKPRRNSYAIDLNRRVSKGSSAGFQWGPKYRELMETIWAHVAQHQLLPGGHLIVNVASHFRDKVYQPVAEWTLEALLNLGLELTAAHLVATPGLRDGQNSEARVGHEMVYLFQRKEAR